MPEPLEISFQGAARTVTGSRHHLRFGDRTLLFDCGLYQGRRDEADRIYADVLRRFRRAVA